MSPFLFSTLFHDFALFVGYDEKSAYSKSAYFNQAPRLPQQPPRQSGQPARTGWQFAKCHWGQHHNTLPVAIPLFAELIRDLLRQGAYRHHVDALRNQLADATGRTLHRLEKLGITPWMKPQGGMFLWVRLPHGLDSAKVSREALHEGVVLAPGNVFSLSQSAAPFMRFNVAQCQTPRIFEVLEKAMGRAG